MKNSTSIALIVAVVCLVAGIAIIGVFAGLNKNLSYGEMFQQTVVEEYEIATEEFPADFDRISIIESEAEVELIRSDVGNPRIEYSVVEDRDYIVTVEDGILDIRVDDRRSSFVSFRITYKEMTLKVYLPEDEYESLTIDSNSGSVIVPADFTFGESRIEASSGSVSFDADVDGTATIKNSSGSVKVSGIQAGKLTVNNTSGSIKITDSNAVEAEIINTSGGVTVAGGKYGAVNVNCTSGSIELSRLTADSIIGEGSSGSVRLEECTVSGEAAVKSSSGSIKLVSCTAGSISAGSSSGSITLDGTVASGKAYLTATSGSVHFKNADAGELEVKTSSGSVKGNLLTGKMFDVRTSSGGENVPASDRDGGYCSINTTSGSVKLTVGE